MYIELNETHMGGHSFEMHLKEVAQEEAKRMLGDLAEFSEEAIAAFKEAAIEPIKNGTFTLERMEIGRASCRERV